MSIPTSLIVVVLVLAWLVVLVPMVARRREAVPEAEMAGGTFRVLRRSSEGTRRRPSFGRRADRPDVGEEPAGEHFSSDEQLDEELLDDEYDDETDEDESFDEDSYDSTGDDGLSHDGSADETYYDRTSHDGGASGVEQRDAYHAQDHAAPVAGTSGGRPSSGSHPYRPDERVSAGSHPYRPSAVDQSPEARRRSAAPPYESAPHDDERESRRFEHEAGDDYSPHQESIATRHPEDVHLRPIPRRSGRGGYDPDAAEVARQFKYSRRRRVAVVLLLAALLFSAAAVLINPVLWAGTAVFSLLLIGYLAYLRRQVQIEASIRERRLARLRRARQIRPEYDLDRADTAITGRSFVRGAVPASQVPPSGYRRGREIVDLEDDDPAFEDLEYYQPLTYRRAAGQ